MRNILLIIMVVGAIAGGYHYFMKNHLDANGNSTLNLVSGKININVVCENSLAYMTFPDEASAEKFVAECKEGKHPEVIEHYKAQMNLGDGAGI
jgi:hypothetical protein